MELTKTMEKLVKDYLKEICESEELQIKMVNSANNGTLEVTIPGSEMKLIIVEEDSKDNLESTEIVSKSLVQEVKEKTIEEELTDTLHILGIPSHIKGFQYLREGILMLIKDVEILAGVTTILYPEMAKKFDTTPSRVERAMRHAIEVAWSRGCVEEFEKIFGYTVSDKKGKPTNSEFLAIVTDYFKLKYKK